MSTFSIQNRVYYEDTDAGGIVYHANYLKFMERARTEWVRSLGLQQNKLLEQSIGFVVIDMAIKFKRSAKLDDEILISCRVKEIKRASIVFEQSVSLINAKESLLQVNENTKDNNNQALVLAEVKVACVNMQSQKPVAIPADLLREMRSAI
jgi:acyl-CoA thioester hydrolase